ncbi:MAG: acyl-CoA dehydrogenase family protein [Acidimicrobiales bacterium]
MTEIAHSARTGASAPNPTASGSGRRYDTRRYRGAAGLNWYSCDPTLQFLMRAHLGDAGLEWAEPHLLRVGALIGGPVAERAAETDRNPPRLERYDRWGHDVSRVVLPATFVESRSALVGASFSSPSFEEAARHAGVGTAPLGAAWNYLLDQAEIGMTCALGTGGDMIVRLSEAFAPQAVKERVRAIFAAGEASGEAAQMLTERTGGSDLGALETAAEPDGDRWRLNGVKWFVSNAGASAFVALARMPGGPDSVSGVHAFLVLRDRMDGTPNGVHVRRLKDKLGTRAVPSGEIELIDAEAWLLAPPPLGQDQTGERPASGLARMMQLTNASRMGVAMMGLGCARRALVEALCYCRSREAFGKALIDHPLAQRKLAEMIVEVEAVQAMVFDGYLGPRLRIGAPLIKLRAARLGVTAASDALELHGGNGYIEDWPVARILRDAQVNPVWDGPDNILCLDVRRAIGREHAHEPLLARISDALGAAPGDDPATEEIVSGAVTDLTKAIDRWGSMEGPIAEARLFPLAQYMADTYAAALLLEQSGIERRLGSTAPGRKGLIARLYARSRLAPPAPLRGIDGPAEDLDNFKLLCDGALVDDRS